MNRFRRFREGPSIDNGSSTPSTEACIVARQIVNACVSPDIFQPEIRFEPVGKKRKTHRKQSAKQKRQAAAFGRRMKACGKKWAAKGPAAKAKTDYRTFQAKFCKK